MRKDIVRTGRLQLKISVHILIMRSVQAAVNVRRLAQEELSGRHKIKMKSLYFQTVGIECKFYENQQLEYRLYSWGWSVFEKLFPQSARPTPRYILPNSVVVARYGAFIVTYILQKTFFKHALLCYDILIGFSRNVFIFQ